MSLALLPDGNQLYYERAGEGPAVVFIHGLADDHRLWRYQLPALQDRFTTIAIDLRGHGRSSKPAGAYSVPQFAADVVALLDQLEIERASLVGLSMGGGTSQTFALAYPERIRSLALISTSSEFVQATRDRFHARAEQAEREGMVPDVVEPMVERWFTPRFRAERADEVELTLATVRANDPFAFAASARANSERNWTDRLGEIGCPVLFIGGAEDPGDARRSATIFERGLPNIEIQILEDASHLLPVEKPEATNVLLRRFLSDTAE
ncbi:MAG TPA: alpha/beta fold hydrolase [Candidatus Limnocylindria bacterium]|nr:alpha/beta fold hydrolase [Candidatus Limnocylindria bacterium]